MAAGAALREHHLAARERRLILGEVGIAAGRVLQPVGVRGLQEEERQVRRPGFGRLPVGRVLPGDLDLDRRDVLPAHEGIEVEQPFLAEEPDVQVDAIEGAQGAHRVGAVLEHAGRPHRGRRLEELAQRAGRHEVVELPVVQAPAAKGLPAPAPRLAQPRPETVDGVHRARVVDVVGRDQGGVERARTGGVEHLEDVARLVGVPVKDAVDPEVLRAHVGAEVLPARALGVGRGLRRDRSDVTEGAGHADPVRLHQVLRQVVVGVVVVPLGIPPLGGRLIEGGVREEAQADDAARLPVVRPHRQVLAAGANRHPRILRLVLEGIGGTVGPALVEPEPVALRVGAGGLLEARLVDQAEVVPAVVPAELERRVRGERLQEIEGPEAGGRDTVPEAVVAAGPHHPGVPAPHFLGSEAHAAVHLAEVVIVRRRERLGRPARLSGLVEHGARSSRFRFTRGEGQPQGQHDEHREWTKNPSRHHLSPRFSSTRGRDAGGRPGSPAHPGVWIGRAPTDGCAGPRARIVRLPADGCAARAPNRAPAS